MCGLIGYIGSKPPSEDKLKLLMLFNIARGTDSTGMAIHDAVYKSTDSADDFIARWDFKITPSDKNHNFIGHTRAGTLGAKTEKNAHPFMIPSDSVEGNLFLAMNGTLSNPHQLGITYNEEFSHGDNDSELLARIIYGLGKDKMESVLEDYEGAANLLFYWRGMINEMYVYKDPERSLFYAQTEDGMYISSLEKSLAAIGFSYKETTAFKDSCLYHIVEGKLHHETKITRATQYASYYGGPNYYNLKGDKKKNKNKEKDKNLKPVIEFSRVTHRYQNVHTMVNYTGMIKIDTRGYRDLTNGEELFMVDGIMMKDRDAFITFNSLVQKSPSKAVLSYSMAKDKDQTYRDASKYSMYPTMVSYSTDIMYYEGEFLVEGYTWFPLLSDVGFTYEKARVNVVKKESTLTADELRQVSDCIETYLHNITYSTNLRGFLNSIVSELEFETPVKTTLIADEILHNAILLEFCLLYNFAIGGVDASELMEMYTTDYIAFEEFFVNMFDELVDYYDDDSDIDSYNASFGVGSSKKLKDPYDCNECDDELDYEDEEVNDILYSDIASYSQKHLKLFNFVPTSDIFWNDRYSRISDNPETFSDNSQFNTDVLENGDLKSISDLEKKYKVDNLNKISLIDFYMSIVKVMYDNLFIQNIEFLTCKKSLKELRSTIDLHFSWSYSSTDNNVKN